MDGRPSDKNSRSVTTVSGRASVPTLKALGITRDQRKIRPEPGRKGRAKNFGHAVTEIRRHGRRN